MGVIPETATPQVMQEEAQPDTLISEPTFVGCLQQPTELPSVYQCLVYLHFQILLYDFDIHRFAPGKCVAVQKGLKEVLLGQEKTEKPTELFQ